MWPQVTEDPLSINLCFLHEGYAMCFVFLALFFFFLSQLCFFLYIVNFT